MIQRHDATDAEIDRLVYDLYDLTADEIALVEATSESRRVAPPRRPAASPRRNLPIPVPADFWIIRATTKFVPSF